MSSLNKATIIGRLGNDPDIRTTQSGDKVANLSIATSERWKDKNTGETKERTEWHRVTAWGGVVNVIEQYCRKGSQIYVEGALETRKWQDQSGADKYTTEIVVKGFNGKVILLDSKEQSPAASNSNGGVAQHNAGQVDDFDSIPF